jgi:hypothetical protein
MTWILFCRIGDRRLHGGAVITRAHAQCPLALGTSPRRDQYEARTGAEVGVACDGAWVWPQLRCDRAREEL